MSTGTLTDDRADPESKIDPECSIASCGTLHLRSGQRQMIFMGLTYPSIFLSNGRVHDLPSVLQGACIYMFVYMLVYARIRTRMYACSPPGAPA